MAKAITGVAELAGAAALGAGAFLTGGAALAIPGYAQAMTTLVISGIASEAGAIADALTSNRGMQISKRQPASNRGIIYGTAMTGGTVVHLSTTGHQYNRLIVLAGHECHSIQGIWIDGRKVYFKGSGPGWSVRNGVGFGGEADDNDHVGPDGITKYDFGGKVYVEARYGDQHPGDYMASLTAQAGSNWGPSDSDSPDLLGCTYIYVKVTASSTQFPQEPEIRVLVNGKCQIFDPRDGQYKFTNNAALVMADVIRDTQFGLGDNNVDVSQLIAAANICDEQVAVAALSGATESRYCCDYSYDTGTPPADVLQTMLAGMAGRLSNVGGLWYIYPGAYVGPAISLDKSSLTAPLSWNPRRSVRELPNRVTGTHISPEWPYSIAGNWYQHSGTGTPDTFDLKFTSTSYPYYAADTLHGYPSDQYLTEDNCHIRPLELPLPTVLSLTQCQRVAKINLMRARKLQGSGTIEVGMGAYTLTPCDTLNFTFDKLGWQNKLLEVTSTTLRCEKDDNDVPTIRYTLNVQETDPSIYAYSTVEELTAYSKPAGNQYTYTPIAPTNLQLESDASTAIVNPDGSVAPAIKVSWDTPLDLQAYGVSIQYKPHPAANWWTWPDVTIDQNSALVTGIVAGQSYDVRIRTVRTTGAYSDWLEQDNYLVPVLDTFLGQLGATLPNTQGWIGKWWRLPNQTGPNPAGGELGTRPLYVTQSSQINYRLYVNGGIDYPYAGVQDVPSAPDGQGNQYIYSRFTGTFLCTATGTYTFGVNSDDGSNLIVNNVKLVSALGGGQPATTDRSYTQSGTVDLIAGQSYPVVLEYANTALSGLIQLLYQGPADSTPQLCDLSFAYRDANQLTYSNGQSVQSLQPAQAGADVTGANTSANTNNVGSRPASDVSGTILPGGGIDYLHVGNLNFPQNSTNLLIRGSFEDGSAGSWYGSVVPVTGQSFHNALRAGDRDTLEVANSFHVVAGQRIYIAGYANTMGISASTGWSCSVGLVFYTAAGTPSWIAAFSLPPQTNWQLGSGFIVVPSDAVTAQPWLQINGPAGGIAPNYFEVANLFYTTSAPIDFNNPGNINQGELSKLNQANTQNIVAGAVNSNIVYQSTAIQFVQGSEQVIGQASINTNGGYVKATVVLYINTSNATFLPTVYLRKGGVAGSLMARATNVNVTTGGYSSVALAAVDAAPSPTQQYTVTLDPGPSADITCQFISLIIENAKV